MAKKDKENKKKASFHLNMSVRVMAKMDRDIAYWCVPGCNEKGSKNKLTTYLWEDDLGFKLPEEVTFFIDYPFDRAYTEKASLVRESRWKKNDGTETVDRYRSDSIGDLIWMGAQAYVNAFKWAKENDIGYWHGIGDLVFEGMTIYEDGTIEFSVGS